MSLQTTQDVYRRVINEVVRELKEDPSMKDILTPPVLDYLKKVRKKTRIEKPNHHRTG
mgnify:CR=1 FL=1